MRTKAFFIMILALLAALYGAAQEAIVVNEGATTTHYVTKHPGNSYVWGMYKDFSPDVEADPAEYEFITPTNTDTIKVRWKLQGMYYLKITESDAGSCSNVKVLPVNVLPPNHTIGFETIASNACTNLNSNGFSLDVNVVNNTGVNVGSEYYPININFMFNGDAYSQTIDYSNQVVNIKEEWINIDSGTTNNLDVQITGARDVSNKQIPVQSGMDLHTRTIYAIPEIKFATNSITIIKGESFEHLTQIVSGESEDAEYSWSVIPAEGSSTDISLITGKTATIMWDGNIGTYQLQVYVKDGNACTSDTIRQQVEIIEPGDLIFNSAYQNTIICSDLARGIEGTQSGHNESVFKVSYSGEANLLSAKITVKNPNGKYIGIDGDEVPDQEHPEIEIVNTDTSKDILIAITDNWENSTGTNTKFEIKLISGINSNQLEVKAVGIINSTRSITVLEKPVIEFN